MFVYESGLRRKQGTKNETTTLRVSEVLPTSWLERSTNQPNNQPTNQPQDPEQIRFTVCFTICMCFTYVSRMFMKTTIFLSQHFILIM